MQLIILFSSNEKIHGNEKLFSNYSHSENTNYAL